MMQVNRVNSFLPLWELAPLQLEVRQQHPQPQWQREDQLVPWPPEHLCCHTRRSSDGRRTQRMEAAGWFDSMASQDFCFTAIILVVSLRRSCEEVTKEQWSTYACGEFQSELNRYAVLLTCLVAPHWSWISKKSSKMLLIYNSGKLDKIASLSTYPVAPWPLDSWQLQHWSNSLKARQGLQWKSTLTAR